MTSVRDAIDEARAFLTLPLPDIATPSPARSPPSPCGSSDAARCLFAMPRPISGTLADAYLRKRGVGSAVVDAVALRFHPRCYYREGDNAPKRTFPALIAAATDNAGRVIGVHHTWLDPRLVGAKAPVTWPRRAMGDLLGFGVRFGMHAETPLSILAAGEGLETITLLRMVMPTMPMIAALSANHLVALLFPSSLGRLYISVNGDRAGRRGMKR